MQPLNGTKNEFRNRNIFIDNPKMGMASIELLKIFDGRMAAKGLKVIDNRLQVETSNPELPVTKFRLTRDFDAAFYGNP